MPREAIALCACLLLILLTTPALSQGNGLPDDPLAEPDRWLSDERWSELRYGLSVREPHDALRVLDTARGEVIRWAQDDGTRISLAFARGQYEGIKNGRVIRMPAKIDLLKKQLGDEMKVAVRGQVINTRNDQVISVGPLVGVINYFIIKPDAPGASPYLSGYGLIQLDQLSVAVVRVECKPENIVQAVSTFECLIQSIRVESAREINRRIHGWLTNSEALLAELTLDDRRAAMKDDRLYRVIENGKDIGYTRIWQRYQDDAFYEQLKAQDKANGGDGRLRGINRFRVEGNAFILQSHFEGRGARMNRLVEAVDAVGEANGYWQIKSSLRYENDPDNRRAGAWAETGVRGVAKIGGKRLDHVQLTREGTPPRHMVDYLLAREKDPNRRLRYPSADPRSYPSGDLKQFKWPTPNRAFLSFVDAQLMPALLPREEKTYAFTAYDPETTRIDIRLMRVEPHPNGGKTVYLRPVLDRAEQTLYFNRDNELVSWTFPDGREMRRTTRQELAKIWGVRLRD